MSAVLLLRLAMSVLFPNQGASGHICLGILHVAQVQTTAPCAQQVRLFPQLTGVCCLGMMQGMRAEALVDIRSNHDRHGLQPRCVLTSQGWLTDTWITTSCGAGGELFRAGHSTAACGSTSKTAGTIPSGV